jgi:cytochrome b6-f complex iron-sulfur subunit
MTVGVGGDATQTSRRRFLNWLLGTSFGALLVSILYPVSRFLTPPTVATAITNETDAGPTDDPVFTEKGYKIVQFGSDPVIVVKAGEGDFRAFSAVCTHLACIVGYRSAQRTIWCNCHNGQFNLEGQVIGGPPPKPLAQYAVHLVTRGSKTQVIVARG